MDMRIPIAGVLVAGGLLGLAMPTITADEEAPTQNSSGEEPYSDSTMALVDANEWSDSLALERRGDGHFYADVVVEGVSTRMLVDTGASVIALTGEDASAMGLYWSEDDVVPVAQGASGAVYGVNVELAHVRLGHFEAENVRAMIIPEGLAISLLGQSFLSTVRTVRIADGRMVLEN